MSGNYTLELVGETYFLKVYANGFNPNPGSGAPIPVVVKNGEETLFDIEMDPSEVVNGGTITGTVSSGGTDVSGALVIAESGASYSSFVTDPDGKYYIYNLTEGAYTIRAFKQNYNCPSVTATAAGGTEVTADPLEMTKDASASISGSITLLATSNSEVDVALVHPVSGETLPGLSVMTTNQQYEITGVPDGMLYLRATYANDGKAMDPDWILKNPGALDVSFSGSSKTLDFSITGAVPLTSPTNTPEDPTPVSISTLTPEFQWEPYSSTSDYVIEVFDSKGNVIWGGFSNDYTVKNVIITDGTAVTYNSDGMATEALAEEKTYRWKIYASKDDTKEASGWKLISASEEQMGIFKVETE